MLRALGGVCGTVTALAASLAFAGAAPAPAGTTQIRGKLAIVSSSGTKITGATLTAPDGAVYRLVMDGPGQDLPRVMFGQQVRIIGVVSERDGQKWLQVVSFAEEKSTQAHELWRRSRCNACAVQRGAQWAAAPRDLRGAEVLVGRLYPGKQTFRSFSRDAKSLWLAADSLLYQVDLASGALVKTYDRTIGLPDAPLLEIASDGQVLWILPRGGAAALPVGGDKATLLAAVKCQFARLCVAAPGAWIIADNATYRYTAPDQPPQTFPAIPTGKRMAQEIEKGMWLPFWQQNTAHYLTEPVAIGDRLYVGSFGDVYELADGTWSKVVPGGTRQQVRQGRLWVLTATGAVEYDPQAGTSKTHTPPDIADGRLTGLVVTESDAWLTAEPRSAPKADESPAGGVARLDLTAGRWQTWKRIDGLEAVHALVQVQPDGQVWLATRQGRYGSVGAHPGMTYVSQTLFVSTGFGLHQWDAAAGAWKTTALPYKNLEKRYICGQDGEGSDAEIGPQTIEALLVAGDRIFASTRLTAVAAFSGFWPCIHQVATRSADGQWTAAFDHHPEQLNLQGEQPLVLNISNKGEMVLPAVGHDEVLDLALVAGRPWVVTQGCVGWFDAAKGAWRKVVELGFNFYWRPSAVLDEGATVFVGSDRGFVSRLDLTTGRCQVIGALKDRQITRLERKEGRLVVFGSAAPLGRLPATLPEQPTMIDADAAAWDGRTWSPAGASPTPTAPLPWQFKPLGSTNSPAYVREQFIGNMLWGPDAAGKDAPRYYIKEIYAPVFLAFGQDGKRMWLSTFTGLDRVDVPGGVTGR
jgi:hypothetical protein